MNQNSFEAPLAADCYWDPASLEGERANLFYRTWIFAGFTEDVAEHNDYISLTVAGLPVVIRNNKGKLAAFRNICTHRHSIIHPEGCGNGMFRCPYHGWSYNNQGVPIGIPDNDRSFGFDVIDKTKLALDPVELDSVGRFLFVRVTAGGPSLRDWLGGLVPELEHISGLFGKIYAREQVSWACNWKIGMEITLEGYHLPVVHAKSFEKHIAGKRPEKEAEAETEAPAETEVLSVGKKPAQDSSAGNSYYGPHSANSAPLSEESMTHLTTVAERLRLPRSDRMTGYDHFLIYPNLMIGVNGGTNVCVERYEPRGPENTRVECWLMMGAPADEKLYDGIIWQTMTKQWRDWTLSVLAEDQGACEGFQKGVRFAEHKGLLGHAEERVRRYQMALQEQMKKTKDKAA